MFDQSVSNEGREKILTIAAIEALESVLTIYRKIVSPAARAFCPLASAFAIRSDKRFLRDICITYSVVATGFFYVREGGKKRDLT